MGLWVFGIAMLWFHGNFSASSYTLYICTCILYTYPRFIYFFFPYAIYHVIYPVFLISPVPTHDQPCLPAFCALIKNRSAQRNSIIYIIFAPRIVWRDLHGRGRCRGAFGFISLYKNPFRCIIAGVAKWRISLSGGIIRSICLLLLLTIPYLTRLYTIHTIFNTGIIIYSHARKYKYVRTVGDSAKGKGPCPGSSQHGYDNPMAEIRLWNCTDHVQTQSCPLRYLPRRMKIIQLWVGGWGG